VGEDRGDPGADAVDHLVRLGERGSAGWAAWDPTLRSGYGGGIALLVFSALCVAAIARDRAHAIWRS